MTSMSIMATKICVGRPHWPVGILRKEMSRALILNPLRDSISPWNFTNSHSERKFCSSQSHLQGSSTEKFIKNNTEVTRNHLTPEIQLHLITKSCLLWNAKEEECPVPDPFWAFYWPGGQALTRFILDNPNLVQGKEVLDVGSGCGASSIAAAMNGAKRVIANDICPVAGAAIQLNAELNNVHLEINQENLIGSTNHTWDVILFGDMFYDQDFTDHISRWIKLLSTKKRTILIGDPGRVYLLNHRIKKQLQCVFQLELPQISREENNGLTHGYVWKHLDQVQSST